jgi:hypothetical protein
MRDSANEAGVGSVRVFTSLASAGLAGAAAAPAAVAAGAAAAAAGAVVAAAAAGAGALSAIASLQEEEVVRRVSQQRSPYEESRRDTEPRDRDGGCSRPCIDPPTQPWQQLPHSCPLPTPAPTVLAVSAHPTVSWTAAIGGLLLLLPTDRMRTQVVWVSLLGMVGLVAANQQVRPCLAGGSLYSQFFADSCVAVTQRGFAADYQSRAAARIAAATPPVQLIFPRNEWCSDPATGTQASRVCTQPQ